MKENYDVIVVGAGHAGCEAALAAAHMGSKTLLFTLSYQNIAFMPCNPSIGGPAKGHLVREIDALGGMMGRVIDQTYLQMRLLNTQKGPAVWALRAQADKQLYQRRMLQILEQQPNLQVRQAEITELNIDSNNTVVGVKTSTGLNFYGSSVIIAAGTFLKGQVFIGSFHFPSGPLGQMPANSLSENLNQLGLPLRRFKTGTPARVRKRSLDFSRMTPQPGGFTQHGFSFWEPWQLRGEHLCWLTYTQPETHKIIREHLNEAALFTGAITGVGPRYCPSIESKLIQFPDKEHHQVFIEPEGSDTDEMYLAGLSTSLPEDVQNLFLRTIPGLEHLEIVRPGYAIEYDSLPGEELKLSLESKKIHRLFFAGQINGSSGYEEAAAQGLIAGINAVQSLRGNDPLILNRAEAYIGVLIDDLVTKDNLEPYRILTSRAEYRLSLRSDNADERLSHYGYTLGLISSNEYTRSEAKYQRIQNILHLWENSFYNPEQNIRHIFEEANIPHPKNRFSIAELLKRPDINLDFIFRIFPDDNINFCDAYEAAIRLKYEGYLSKEREQAKKLLNLEKRKIPEDLDYQTILNLSREAREKLIRYRPSTLGQASRISGISPADLTALLFHVEKNLRSTHESGT